MNELAAIAGAAGREGLRFIPLKGTAMIIGGYDNALIRPMTDVDLLVREKNYPQWQKLLCENGYGPLPFSRSSFVKQDATPAIFDLHTSLRFLTPGLLTAAWVNSSATTYATIDYELLPIETDLLYRCLHMTITHGYGGEKWLRDMDMLLRAHAATIDWETLAGQARDSQAAAPLTATLHFLRERYATPVPEEVVDELDKCCSPAVAALFARTLRRRSGLPFFDYIAPLLVRPSFPSMVTAAWTKLFPPLATMQQRYSTASKAGAAAMYPVRALMLAGKGICAMLHSLQSFVVSRARHRAT